MADLKDVLAYLVKNYPIRSELSNARLTKMVYLADWHQAINRGRQITDINWYFDNFGPFVKDVEETAIANPDLFLVETAHNMYGQPKKQFDLIDENYVPQVSEHERASLDHIINVTRPLYWREFIKLVYSTHPIASSQRYSYLDLAEKAKEYALSKKKLAGSPSA